MTFVLFFRMARGDFRAIWINTEFKWYVGAIVFFCGVATWILWDAGTYEFADSVRYATFQVVSILTTTGFTTADYELWPGAAQMVLYVVCFIGACAGSTTSGIKIVHYVLIWKFIVAAVKKMFFQPLAIVSVRLDGLRVDQAVYQPRPLLLHREYVHGRGRGPVHVDRRGHGRDQCAQFGDRHADEHRTRFR